MEEQHWLEQYVQNGSQEAFACLVRKHLSLVYGVALRQVRDRQLAEDAAQATFALLARKAASFRDARALPNWLYKAARYASANVFRLEQNRRRHEKKAAIMRSENEQPEQRDATWQQILPALEQAMDALPDPDRQALLLRFYEDRSLREVGDSLGVSEEAARKRVDRAVGKLREALVPAGVAVGASADLAALLAANACTPAPTALANVIATTACHAAAHASLSTVTLTLKGGTSIMATTTAKIVGAALGAAIVIGGAAVISGRTSASGGTAQPPAPAAAPAPAPAPAAAPAKAQPVAATAEPLPIADAMSKIKIGRTTREELVMLLGDPNSYTWNNQTFTVAQLPGQYVMPYNGVTFMIGDDIVEEVRFEGPNSYRFRDKIQFGSPVADVLEVLGQPKKTVEGQRIAFEEGVLYRKCNGRGTGMAEGYYQRSDQGVRIFFANDRVVALYLTRTVADADNSSAAASTFTSNKTDQLQWGTSTREDVVKVMGEPAKYLWGTRTFTPDTLPDTYIMQYPGDDQVVISRGIVSEIRVHRPGPFQFKGLKIGSPLSDVLKIVGQPANTVDGGPNGWQDGVLYKNIDKRPGYGYYQRTDVGIRMFLADDTVATLYLIPPRE